VLCCAIMVLTSFPSLPLPRPTDASDLISDSLYQREHPVDQRVISNMAKPGSLVDKYRSCEPPPDLNKMNPYRDDNLVRDVTKRLTSCDKVVTNNLTCERIVSLMLPP
jgi:hypothetical protein